MASLVRWSFLLTFLVGLASLSTQATPPKETQRKLSYRHHQQGKNEVLSNEIETAPVRKEARSFWDNKFFRKISHLFKRSRSKKLQRRTSYFKRTNKFLPEYLIPPKLRRKKAKPYSSPQKAVHPYKFVFPKQNKHTPPAPNKPKVYSQSTKHERTSSDQASRDTIPFEWDPPPYYGPHQQKTTVLKNEFTSNKKVDNPSLQESMTPPVVYYPRRRKDFIIPKNENVASISVNSGLSYPAKNSGPSFPAKNSSPSFPSKKPDPIPFKPKPEKAKNPTNRVKENSFINRISSFTTNMLDEIFPKSTNGETEPKKIKRRKQEQSPIPRPYRVRVPYKQPGSKRPQNLERSYAGFQPSPQEGSFLADAFQPVFVPSQTLESAMRGGAMKPMIMAESRKATIKKNEPTPPEIINFF